MPPCSEHSSSRSIVTVPLLRRESIGNSYHVLSFDAPDADPALPGQFAMLRGADWGDAPFLPRPMSYLSGGRTPSCLIKVCGEGTIRMGRAEPSEPFTLVGPLGKGWRAHDPARRQILVAGGVGIAPLLFLARDLVTKGARPLLVYGGRTDRDLPLLDDAQEICEVEVTTEDGSMGGKGLVTAGLEEWLGSSVEVFTCGPNAMMAAVLRACEKIGVPCEVSLEAPMACGFGVCLGCAVPKRDGSYLYACTEGPCVDGTNVDFESMLKPGSKR